MGPEGDAHVGDTFVDGQRSRRHAACALHRAVASASGHLFRRSHASRYFGGFWFKLFCERGPC